MKLNVSTNNILFSCLQLHKHQSSHCTHQQVQIDLKQKEKKTFEMYIYNGPIILQDRIKVYDLKIVSHARSSQISELTDIWRMSISINFDVVKISQFTINRFS